MGGLSNFKIEKDIKRQLCCGIQLGEVQIRFAFQMHNTFDVDVDDDHDLSLSMCGMNMFCAKLLINLCVYQLIANLDDLCIIGSLC